MKTPCSESSIQTDTMSHITNLVPRPNALQFGKLTIFNKYKLLVRQRIISKHTKYNVLRYYTLWNYSSNFGGLWGRALRPRENTKKKMILKMSPAAWYGSGECFENSFSTLNKL